MQIWSCLLFTFLGDMTRYLREQPERKYYVITLGQKKGRRAAQLVIGRRWAKAIHVTVSRKAENEAGTRSQVNRQRPKQKPSTG